MKLPIAAVLFSILISPASSTEPSEADKALALRLAYEANGRSMVGWGSYDFEDLKRAATAPVAVTPERVVPAAPKKPKHAP